MARSRFFCRCFFAGGRSRVDYADRSIAKMLKLAAVLCAVVLSGLFQVEAYRAKYKKVNGDSRDVNSSYLNLIKFNWDPKTEPMPSKLAMELQHPHWKRLLNLHRHDCILIAKNTPFYNVMLGIYHNIRYTGTGWTINDLGPFFEDPRNKALMIINGNKNGIRMVAAVDRNKDISDRLSIRYSLPNDTRQILKESTSIGKGTNFITTCASVESAVVFVNAIQRIFDHVKNPAIRFHIVAITIANTTDKTPYIKNNMLPSGKGFHWDKAINDMSTYFYNVKDQIYVEYDIVLGMTALPMIGHNIGGSRHGAACKVSTGRMEAVVLYYDSGEYKDIFVAAHEIGHLFGLRDEKTLPKKCTERDCLSSNWPTFSTDSLSVFRELQHNGSFSCMDKEFEEPLFNPSIRRNVNHSEVVNNYCQMLKVH